MARWSIIQTASGADLGVYDAETADDALDAYARAAGYESFAAIPEEIGGGDTLSVEEAPDGR